MIVKIISGQFLKFFRGLLVQCIDFIHRGFRVCVSLDVNEGQLLNELLLHGITSFLPPQFYHGRGRGTSGAERRKGVRGMDTLDLFAAGFLVACLLFEIFQILLLIGDGCLVFIENLWNRFKGDRASGPCSDGFSFSILNYSLSHPMKEHWTDLKMPNQSEMCKDAGRQKKFQETQTAEGDRGRQ